MHVERGIDLLEAIKDARQKSENLLWKCRLKKPVFCMLKYEKSRFEVNSL